jgi:hypothetical protein
MCKQSGFIWTLGIVVPFCDMAKTAKSVESGAAAAAQPRKVHSGASQAPAVAAQGPGAKRVRSEKEDTGAIGNVSEADRKRHRSSPTVVAYEAPAAAELSAESAEEKDELAVAASEEARGGDEALVDEKPWKTLSAIEGEDPDAEVSLPELAEASEHCLTVRMRFCKGMQQSYLQYEDSANKWKCLIGITKNQFGGHADLMARILWRKFPAQRFNASCRFQCDVPFATIEDFKCSLVGLKARWLDAIWQKKQSENCNVIIGFPSIAAKA